MESVLYRRIKELCDKNNITISKLESDLGFGSSSINKWKQITSPSVDKVVKIAGYFNVSIDYLLGRSNIESSITEILGDKDIISLQRARQKMSAKDRDKMMQMLKLGFEYAFNNDDDGGEQ